MNALPPRSPARDARRQAIVDIARDSFLTDGYAATSMSSIAGKVGGSKGTLYNYFRSKDELFEAIMTEECGAEAAALSAIVEGGDLEQVLHRMGERVVRFLTSERALGVNRLVSAECQRFPHLGRLFWDSGPKLTHKVISDYLAARMEDGTLRRDDPERCAAYLVALFKSGLHQAMLWAVRDPPSDQEIVEHVDGAVRVFLTGYSRSAQAS